MSNPYVGVSIWQGARDVTVLVRQRSFSSSLIKINFCLGVLVDSDANGMHSTTDVYSNLDIDKIEILAPSSPHPAVDLTVVEADTQGIPQTAYH